MRPDRIIWLDDEESIRLSTPNDGQRFLELWTEYLTEQYEAGGELVPSSSTLSTFMQLFRLYTQGENPVGPSSRGTQGVVVFGAKENAVLLWGATGVAFDFRWGRTANGWGTYVRPKYREQGWSARMRECAGRYMRDALGFEAVMGMATDDNKVGLETGIKAGFEIYGKQGVLRLRE